VIRFSAALVIVGLGLLAAGAIAGNMTLVYAAIAVSVCAALVLAAGMIVGRDELFGRGATAAGAERTLDRGVTPGPGAAAIPAVTAGAGLRSLGGRNLAAASAQAGSPGPSYTGVGWPGGQSPADELWARVDAELAAADASSRAPRLTKESSSDEVWGRVDEELAVPPQWDTRLVIPAGEEAASAEQEPAAEPAAQPAWADPAAWAERPGWADSADRTEQLVVVEWADAPDGAEPAETSPDAAGAAPDRAEVMPDAADAAPDRDEAAPPRDGASPDRAEAVPDAGGAAPAHAEAAPDADGAAPGRDEAAPDRDGAAPDHAEAMPDADGAAPGRDEAAPDRDGATPDQGEATPDRAAAGPDGQDANPASAAPAANPAGEPGDTPPAASAHAQAPGTAAGEPGGDPGAELLAAPSATDTPLSSYVSAAPHPPGAPYPQGRASGPGPEPGRVIVVSGVPRYHRPGCILIRFLGQDDVESTTREAAEASGCVPCRACQPDHLSSAAGSGSAAESGAVG
jgi:nicotinate-nucleotide--dimethylbenzimidazole phosphoribosyltransferase